MSEPKYTEIFQQADGVHTMPRRATTGSVAFDCFLRQTHRIGSGDTVLAPLGFRLSLPTGWRAHLYERSSGWKKLGIELTNKVGIIDSDYRDEVLASLHRRPYLAPECYLTTHAGSRVCQIMVISDTGRLYLAPDRPVETARLGGFGSTGI